jgi:hypothetical protein
MSKSQIAAKGPFATLGGAQTDGGKTTIAKNLCHYLRTLGVDAKHLMVDKAENPSDGEDLRLETTDRDFRRLIEALNSSGPDQLAVIDLGGHAFEKFMVYNKAFGNEASADIQMYIIPVMVNTKEAVVLTTIDKFVALGVEPSQLVIVFNRVLGDDEAAEIPAKFPQLHAAAADLGFRICSEPVFMAQTIADLRGKEGNLFERAAWDRKAIQERYKAAMAADDQIVSDREFRALTDRGQAIEPSNNFVKVFTEILGLK